MASVFLPAMDCPHHVGIPQIPGCWASWSAKVIPSRHHLHPGAFESAEFRRTHFYSDGNDPGAWPMDGTSLKLRIWSAENSVDTCRKLRHNLSFTAYKSGYHKFIYTLHWHRGMGKRNQRGRRLYKTPKTEVFAKFSGFLLCSTLRPTTCSFLSCSHLVLRSAFA